MTEKNESRIKVEDLPAPIKELDPEEAEGIQGGQEAQALRGEAANIKATCNSSVGQSNLLAPDKPK